MFRTEEGQVVNGLALVLEGGEAVVEGMVMRGGEGVESAHLLVINSGKVK